MEKTKKRYFLSVIAFGILLAVLIIVLKVFQYRYLIGSLDTEFYTAAVATLFTAIGIWFGLKIMKPKNKHIKAIREIDQEKIQSFKLNNREYEILTLIAQGLSNQEVANKLFIALPTVKTHTSNLYTKLEVKSRTQAIHKAQSLNLI